MLPETITPPAPLSLIADKLSPRRMPPRGGLPSLLKECREPCQWWFRANCGVTTSSLDLIVTLYNIEYHMQALFTLAVEMLKWVAVAEIEALFSFLQVFTA